MSWAEIKNSLNSTMGTDGFKPLDTLIEGYILRNKTYIPSDNTLLTWSNEFELHSTSSGAKETIGTYKPYINGRANIEIFARTLNNNYAYFRIDIYENESIKYTTTNSGIEDSTIANYINNVVFLAGNTYRFEFVATTVGSSGIQTEFKSLNLKADLIDGFPYDFTIGG